MKMMENMSIILLLNQQKKAQNIDQKNIIHIQRYQNTPEVILMYSL